MTADGLADRFFTLENKFDHLKEARATSSSEPKILEIHEQPTNTLE